MRNAAIIIKTGADLKLPPRAWVIAIATSMQESRLSNLGYLGARNDHDSLGLFQQRPSAGWGTPQQVMDPVHAATKFYNKLKSIKGWESMALTEAAQRVQISAYPDAYAKHESIAREIVNLLADGAANAVGNSLAMVCAAGGQIAASGWTIPLKSVVGSGFRTRSRPTHQGVDLIVGRYTPIGAAASGTVSVVKCDEDHNNRRTCNVDGYPGKGGCGWMVEIVHAGNVMTRYCHMVQRPFVQVGQQVKAGQILGKVGTSGNSSGPHLHFEVHLNNDRRAAARWTPCRSCSSTAHNWAERNERRRSAGSVRRSPGMGGRSAAANRADSGNHGCQLRGRRVLIGLPGTVGEAICAPMRRSCRAAGPTCR